jgi:serine/threonine protein kinase
MEAHVEACTNCQKVLERLAALPSISGGSGGTRLAEMEQPPTIPGFVIEREIGRGGMGVVYQAWQPQLDRRVAVKVVSASAEIGAEDRRRWLREARATGRVRHRNVVQLHEVGQQDGCLYLVLDLITGGSLAERITGPFPERVAGKLMATVAQAVDQIHKAGMLHLDIKPSNILLDGPADGPWDQVTPMLGVFGIARAGDDPGATATGQIGIRGTPSFMAPEQVAGARVAIGPRTDVYALGGTLYSLLTGRPPFQAASVIETLDLVRTREPAPPRTLVPGLSRDLETIALTCLRKDPRRRYASAEALADDLKRWLDGFPIGARPVSKLEHVGRWCRRRPALASLLALFAITVVSSLLGLLTLWRHSEAERRRAEDALARMIESDAATSMAVGDLVGLLTSPVQAPHMLAHERLVESSRVVRNLTAKLRQGRAVAASNVIAICRLECDLAESLSRRGNYAESNRLLADAVEFLEGQGGGADDPDLVVTYARVLMRLSWDARVQERYDEMLAWLRRAEKALEDLAQDRQTLEIITTIDSARGEIAWLFEHRGQDESRRRLLESHVRMLERMSERAGSDPEVGLLAALNRAAVAPDHSDIARVRAAMARFPADRPISHSVVDKLGMWVAHDIQPYPSDPTPPGKPRRRPDPDAHARAIIRALDSRCEAAGGHPALFSAGASRMFAIAHARSIQERNAGRLDDARSTAATFLAFGQSLVRRDPNEATFHVLLCEGFEEEAKNAWRVNDFATIEAATRNALAEASTALRLDPRNPYARLKVGGLQEKMIGLTSQRPSSK